jgi:sugar O-acyltransferase (sialic acid O-acetyltransferase NeuD family)
MPPTPILVPLLNANEPEARLVAVHAQNGQSVRKGDLLFTIETTKAASDIEAPEAGFLRLVAHDGDTLAVRDVLAFLTKTADEQLPVASEQPTLNGIAGLSVSNAKTVGNAPLPSGAASLRITKPARALAESIGLDLASLPTDRLITEAVLREITGKPAQPVSLPGSLSTSLPGSQVLLYGAGGHAKAVMEMVQAIGAFCIAGIVDDNAALTGNSVLGILVLGTREILPRLLEQGIRLAANGVGGIIDLNIREKLFDLLDGYGFAFPILRHPRATVEPSAQIFDGVQIFANAYVGSSTILHERCMINTGAIVSHDCEIGCLTHIAPGAMLAGHVHVGKKALVGMGVTTTIGIKIGSGARIGNGAILLADVPDRAIVPAGKVWA